MPETPSVSNTATPEWAERPATIRSELVRRIRADLLGPLDGDDEVVRGFQREDGTWTPSGRVKDRYLVGKLAPAGTVARDPERLAATLRDALNRAELCSTDPMCADHQANEAHDTLHHAACHACMFVPETSCEHGNRYLDRATVVPTLSTPDLAYFT